MVFDLQTADLRHPRLSRLHCLAALAFALVTTLTFPVSAAKAANSLNVKDFGAKGDGVTDDYDAMVAAAATLCHTPDATLIYPPGAYRINRYRITGGPGANHVLNVRYVGCMGVNITGSGAKIDVKGDFRRGADLADGKDMQSYSNSVIPFEFVNSSQFHLTGFEIDGHVDRMTRDARVVEGTGTGILTTNCKDYSIENVFVHHFSADGITLGGNSTVADQRAHLDHVTSMNNARQGLSISQVRDATIVNSEFSNTGRTGAYGSHAPAAGVDVEPVRRPPDEDVYTGLIVFDNCRFEENIGSQFVSGWPDKVESLTIKNSHIKATLPDTSPVAFMSVPRTGTAINNQFEIAAGHSVYAGTRLAAQYSEITNLTFRGNKFLLGDHNGIVAPLRQAPVDLVDNEIKIVNSAQGTDTLHLDNFNLIDGNHFIEASEGDGQTVFGVVYDHGKTTVRNNHYEVDRAHPVHLGIRYGSGITPSGDVFANPEYVGAADHTQ